MFSLKHIIPWSLTLICAAHLAAPTASANSLALARLNRNGSLDGALSVDGFWQADLPGTPPCTSPHAFETLSAGGKIYLAGRACGQGFVIRVWPGGAFDTSWAGSGAVRTTKLTVLAMAVDTMGRIVVAGEGPSQFAVARFTHGGQLDTSFGTAGVTYVDFPGAVGVSGQDMGLALQSDGKVVVAGTLALSGGKGAMAAMRLTTTGQLDKTYSADGRVTFDFTSMDSEFALDVAIDSKNRAILAGTASSGSFPSYRNQFAAALQFLLDIRRKVQIRQLQQLDRLHQLRRHHQRLGLSKFEFLRQRHASIGPNGPILA